MRTYYKISDKNPSRITISIAYNDHKRRQQIKRIKGFRYHSDNKTWTIPNTPKNLALVKEMNLYNIVHYESDILKRVDQKIQLKNYSQSTINTYKSQIIQFLDYFSNENVEDLTKDEIETYVYYLKNRQNISLSKQNQVINAIKFYYEHVLGRDRTYYDITRPKKSKVFLKYYQKRRSN